MKFFIDTANLNQIAQAQALGVLDGVTTNPSLMAREGIRGTDRIMAHYKAICDLVEDCVSAEVISTDYDGMMREAGMLAAIDPKIVVKIPMLADGIRAINSLYKLGVRTNCTLIFGAGQALLAAKAGATYVSPFIGRLDDLAIEGIDLIRQLVDIFEVQGFETQVLAASIRSPLHIVQCAEAGAHVATCPLSAIIGLVHHPLTEKGLAQFLADHAKNNG
ncbi:MAG: fructose-6-phosphate aldolase [Sphingomonadales bacterium]|nr:fructose-6-phosphate aldolase [Sphingomonadales bacterium]